MTQEIKLGDLYTLLNSINDNLCTKIDNIKIDLDKLGSKVDKQLSSLERKIELLESENKELKHQVHLTQRFLKKKNLIIYGVPERNSENLVESVIDLIKEKLEINLRIEDISECFRLGKIINKDRPILIGLVSSLKRTELLKNKTKLKGTNIFINEDLVAADRENKKFLVEKLKEARAQNREAKLKGNKLIVDGVSYTSEEASGSRTLSVIQDINQSNYPESQPEGEKLQTPKTVELLSHNSIGNSKDLLREEIPDSERKRKAQEIPNIFREGTAKRAAPYRTRANSNNSS